MNRERTYQWQDPMITGEGMKSLTGLEGLQRVVDGRFPQPPITSALGYKLSEVAEGHAIFTIVPQEYHYNPIGSMHGGVIATASAKLQNADGKLYAHATTTGLIFAVNNNRNKCCWVGIF